MRSCHRFLGGIPHLRVDTHVLLTRPPLTLSRECVRLACVRHAASVYPEPGSNSPFMMYAMRPKSHSSHKVLSCDPGQTAVVVTVAFGCSRKTHCICTSLIRPIHVLFDRNCVNTLFFLVCLLTFIFCSAFHSSIVKVLCLQVYKRFAHYLTVDVVSHIASALSSFFQRNFA